MHLSKGAASTKSNSQAEAVEEVSDCSLYSEVRVNVGLLAVPSSIPKH